MPKSWVEGRGFSMIVTRREDVKCQMSGEITMSCSRLFLLGTILLFLGIQFRIFDSFVLNQRTSNFIHEKFDKKSTASAGTDLYNVSLQSNDDWWMTNNVPQVISSPRKTITPPDWLGWSFVSVGAVLILTCPCFRSST